MEQQNTDWLRVTQCLQQLPDHQRDVMTQFYLHDQSLVQLAESTGRKANAIGQTLYRARLAILQCVKKLAGSDSAESDSAESDSAESDSAESDSAESDSAESDSAESDSAESDSAESDSVERDIVHSNPGSGSNHS